MSITHKLFSYQTILEAVIAILQYDLKKLFTAKNACNLCGISEKGQGDNIIQHDYGCRPLIYDGGRENVEDVSELVEHLRADISQAQCALFAEEELDLNNNAMQFEGADNENGLNFSDDDFNKSSLSGQEPEATNAIVNENSMLSKSNEELNDIEQKVQLLWAASQDQTAESDNENKSTWQNLKSWEKLPFYLSILSNEILSEIPFENFKSFYIHNSATLGLNFKQSNEKCLIIWHSLTSKQKLPFIMEAFMAHISAGKVNITDELEIKKIMKTLQNKAT